MPEEHKWDTVSMKSSEIYFKILKQWKYWNTEHLSFFDFFLFFFSRDKAS